MAAAPSLHCISAYLHFWKRPFWGELGSLNVDTVYKSRSAVCLPKPSRQSATESCLSCPATPGGCSEKSYFPFPFPLSPSLPRRGAVLRKRGGNKEPGVGRPRAWVFPRDGFNTTDFTSGSSMTANLSLVLAGEPNAIDL